MHPFFSQEEIEAMPLVQVETYETLPYVGSREMVGSFYMIGSVVVNGDRVYIKHLPRNVDIMLTARGLSILEKKNTERKGRVSKTYLGHHLNIKQQTIAVEHFDVPLYTELKTSNPDQHSFIRAAEDKLNSQYKLL